MTMTKYIDHAWLLVDNLIAVRETFKDPEIILADQ